MDLSSCAQFSHMPPYGRCTPALFRLAAAVTIAAALFVAPAQGTAVQRKASVASHIPEAGVDPVRPVAVIDREEIALSGMRTVSDLLVSRQRFNSFGLHRVLFLGSRVAYLINGRRISDSTLDLSTLPISVVERIEILSGSAAALHGGHAIAGAINIVLRRDDDGVEASAFAGRPTDAGGDTDQGSASWGGAVGQGHMTVAVDVFRREEIPDAAREHSRAKWTPGGTFADASGVSVGGNTVFIATRSHDENGDVTATHVPGVVSRSIARPLGDCPSRMYTGALADPLGSPGTGCGFAYADISWAMEHYGRESLFLALDHPFGDGADAYLDIRAARDETLERYAPSVGTFSVSSETLRDQLLPDPEIDSLPETLRVSHRFIGHDNREWLTTLDEYDVALGLEGQFADGIGYDAHLRYYRHEAVVDGNTFVSGSAIQQVIDEGRYDLVNPLSPANLDAIRETALRLTRDRVTDHRMVRASVDGPMFALVGGEARWAAGAEFVAEDWRDVHAYRDRSGRSYDAKDVLGAGGIQVSGERQRWSGFGEVALPVRHDWDVTLAGRGDGHDDVGATYSHQLASRFRLHHALMLRGSWDRGSRPPSLYELHLRSSNDFPWVCDRNTHRGALETCPVEQVVRVSSGNSNLEPDDAESVSLGAVIGLGPLSLSADWFRIALSDVPDRLSPQSIIDLEARGALPPGVAVIRTQEGKIERIDSPIVNSGETDASGVDVRARLDWNAPWADLALDTRWLRMTQQETRVAGELQPGDYPRARVHGSLRASRGRLTTSWSVYSVSGYWNMRRTGRFDGWMGHDITVRWRDPFGLSRMDLTGGVLNIADRGPAIDPTDPDAADVSLDSGRGRTIFLTATMSW